MRVQVIEDNKKLSLLKDTVYTVYSIVTVMRIVEQVPMYRINYCITFPDVYDMSFFRGAEYFKIIDGTLPPSWRFTQYSGENIELDTTHYGFTHVLGFKEMVEDRTFAHKLWYDAAEPEYEIFDKRKAEIDAELGYMD
jgi:hypothetical protein